MRILELVELCRKKVQKSTVDCARVVAIAVASGSPRAVAVNMRATCGGITPWTIHAEEMLVRKMRRLRLRERFGSPTVYVVRFNKAMQRRPSKPCASCERMLRQYGFSDVWYVGSDGLFERLASPP